MITVVHIVHKMLPRHCFPQVHKPCFLKTKHSFLQCPWMVFAFTESSVGVFWSYVLDWFDLSFPSEFLYGCNY